MQILNLWDKNNPEKLSTTKADEHILSGFSMSPISSFKDIENKHDVCWGKDCMKKFCESLRDHSMEVITFKKKKMDLSTNEQQEPYGIAKNWYIWQENFENKYAKDKEYCKVRDDCHYTGECRGAVHSICNLKYSMIKQCS